MSSKKLPISPEVELLFARQQVILRRCISILFALAGFSWFLLWLPDSIADSAHHNSFRNGQYQVYTVLLTLWGYDYRRQSLRLNSLILLSTTLGKLPDALTVADIRQADKIHLFEIFTKHSLSTRKYFHIGFIWLLLSVAVALLVKQGVVLFQ